MSERSGYDPSRDPNAVPNVAGAHWDTERHQWMMPSNQAPRYIEQPHLPVAAHDKQPGLVVRKVHEERISLEGESLPDILNLLSGVFQGVQQQQSSTQYAPEQPTSIPYVEQIQPGWDVPPVDGPFANRSSTPETKRLPITEDTLVDKVTVIGTKEKKKRAIPARFIMKLGATGIVASSVFAGVALATDRSDPNLILFKADVPQVIDNYQNWGPVKGITRVGKFILP
jgi:hypothetical protein